jgi:hypothetical protein
MLRISSTSCQTNTRSRQSLDLAVLCHDVRSSVVTPARRPLNRNPDSGVWPSAAT